MFSLLGRGCQDCHFSLFPFDNPDSTVGSLSIRRRMPRIIGPGFVSLIPLICQQFEAFPARVVWFGKRCNRCVRRENEYERIAHEGTSIS